MSRPDDDLLDRVVAEAQLAGGVPLELVLAQSPPGLAVDAAYAFITVAVANRRWLPWSPAQEAVLAQWYGRVSRAELVRQVNAVVHRETGTISFDRTYASIANRARYLGLTAYTGDAAEMCVRAAADFAGLNYDLLHRAISRGELPSIRRGKRRYVSKSDLLAWLEIYRQRVEARAKILQQLAGIETVSKQEAMVITGLGETHLSRYLATGIVVAWKLPDLAAGNRGEWLVSKQSAEQIGQLRREGRLVDEVLRRSGRYLKVQQANSQAVAELRRRQRLNQPDPLTTPKSKYLPGCFTVQQVASHLRRPVQAVYEAIRAGRLRAGTVKAGGRLRYAITGDEARRFAAGHDIDRFGRFYQEQEINRAGWLTIEELAARWGKSPPAAQAIVRQRRLPFRKWGRRHVYLPAEVQLFEQQRGLVPQQGEFDGKDVSSQKVGVDSWLPHDAPNWRCSAC